MFIYANTPFPQILWSWSRFSYSIRNSIGSQTQAPRPDPKCFEVFANDAKLPYSLIVEIRNNRSIRVILTPDYRSLTIREGGAGTARTAYHELGSRPKANTLGRLLNAPKFW
jgi:hypothetical protein